MGIALLPTYLCGSQCNTRVCFGGYFCITSMVSERKVAPHNIKALDLEGNYVLTVFPTPKLLSHLFISVAEFPAIHPRFWDVSW